MKHYFHYQQPITVVAVLNYKSHPIGAAHPMESTPYYLWAAYYYWRRSFVVMPLNFVVLISNQPMQDSLETISVHLALDFYRSFYSSHGVQI